MAPYFTAMMKDNHEAVACENTMQQLSTQSM